MNEQRESWLAGDDERMPRINSWVANAEGRVDWISWMFGFGYVGVCLYGAVELVRMFLL